MQRGPKIRRHDAAAGSSANLLSIRPTQGQTFCSGRTLTKANDEDYAIDAIASPGIADRRDFGVDVMGDFVNLGHLVGPVMLQNADALTRKDYPRRG